MFPVTPPSALTRTVSFSYQLQGVLQDPLCTVTTLFWNWGCAPFSLIQSFMHMHVAVTLSWVRRRQGGVRSGDPSDPLAFGTCPAGFPRIGIGDRRGQRTSNIFYGLLYSAGIYNSLTHTHTHSIMWSEEPGLEVNFWPFGTQPRPLW